MKIDVTTNARELATSLGVEIGVATEGALDDTLPGAKDDLRDQTTRAGLGRGVANAWRDRRYDNEQAGTGPAGFVWSRAPAIVDGFARGVTIRPVHGARYLWIPTKNVPRGRARLDANGVKRTGALSPDEVQRRFHADFVIRRGKGGALLAFIDVVAGLNGRGYRPKTGPRLARGRRATPVLMFVLVASVKEPKLLDLDGAAERWVEAFEGAFVERLTG